MLHLARRTPLQAAFLRRLQFLHSPPIRPTSIQPTVAPYHTSCSLDSRDVAPSSSSPSSSSTSPFHAALGGVFNSRVSDSAAPIGPLTPPTLHSTQHLTDERIKVKTPWYPVRKRVDWELLPFAQRNDYEGVFTHLESVARQRLREEEEAAAHQRQQQRQAAIEAGKSVPIFEEDQPWETLSKKARKRLKSRLTSESSSIDILHSLSSTLWVDLFQTFASLGRLDALEYFSRRFEQIQSRVIDERLVDIWMDGIVLACVAQRQAEAAKKLGQPSTSTAEQVIDEEQQVQPEQSSPTPSQTNKRSSNHTKNNAPPTETPSSSSSSSSSASSSSASVSTTSGPNSLASHINDDPYLTSVGLPASGLAWTQITQVLVLLRRHSIMPTFRFVRTAFECFALDNDVHSGLAFITELYKLKYYVSGFTYALLIQALAKHQHSAGCMFVFLHMEKARFAPHAQTFNALISAFAQVGDYQTAYRLMQDMQASKLQPDGQTFAALLEACVRAGKMELALEMFQYLKKNVNNLTTTKQVRLPSDANQRASAATGAAGSTTDIRHIKLLAQDQRPKAHQQVVPLTLGPEPYAILISEYLDRGETSKAMDLLNEMVESGIRPLVRTYNHLLRTMRAESRTREATQLWRQMKAMEVPPTLATYNTYLPCLSSFEEARVTIQEMRKGKMMEKTNENEDTTLMSAALHHGPLRPDAVTIHRLLTLLSKYPDLIHLPWIYELMRSEKIPPTGQHIQMTVRLLQQCHRQDASQLFRLSFAKFGPTILTADFITRIATGSPTELKQDWNKLKGAINESEDGNSSGHKVGSHKSRRQTGRADTAENDPNSSVPSPLRRALVFFELAIRSAPDHLAGSDPLPLMLKNCVNRDDPYTGQPVREDALTYHRGYVVGFAAKRSCQQFDQLVRQYPDVQFKLRE